MEKVQHNFPKPGQGEGLTTKGVLKARKIPCTLKHFLVFRKRENVLWDERLV